MKICFKHIVFLLFALNLILSSCTGKARQGEQTTKATDIPKEIASIKNGRQIPVDFMKNPLGVTKIADPFILYDNDTYYMYATYSDSEGFYCWTSKTCSSWTQYGRVYSKTAASYGTLKYWAPEVYKHGGKYYMFYSSKKTDEGFHAISVAVADKATGPFTDYITPLYNPDFSVIDANILFDDDGRIYLYYAKDGSTNIINGCKTSQIYGVELSGDMKSLLGEPKLLSTPDNTWEKQSGSSQQWNEGPCVFKYNGVYYLMFSANYYKSASYSVGYATSDSPLGTYVKYSKNPILKGDGSKTAGTGHNNIFASPDGTELFTVYHSLTNPGGEYEYRQLCVDRMLINDNGTLSVNGPSLFLQPLPSGTKSITPLSGESYTINCTDSAVSAGNTALLSDGHVAKSFSGLVTLKHGSSLELGFKEEKGLAYLLIYPSPLADTCPSPASVTVLINDMYLISDIIFDEKALPSPAVIAFDNLPEGVLISEIELTFTTKEGSGDCSISEIAVIRKGEN